MAAAGAAATILLVAGAPVRGDDRETAGEVWRSPVSGATYRVEFSGTRRTKRLVAADGRTFSSVLAVVRAEDEALDPVDRVLAAGLADLPGDSAAEVVLVLRRQPLAERAAAFRMRLRDARADALEGVRAPLARIAELRTAEPGRGATLRDVVLDEERLLTAGEKSRIAAARVDLLRRRNAERTELLAGLEEEVAGAARRVVETIERDFQGSVLGVSSALATVSVRIPAGRLRDVVGALPEVARILPLDHLRGALDISTPVVGGPGISGTSVTGSGAKVAILDTGIDALHPGFGSRVVASSRFQSAASSQGDFNDSSTTDDVQGHGTRVAGAAGSGDWRYAGVAPGVQLINAKIGYRNTSQLVGAVASDAFAGGDWAANQGADVMNVSLFATGTPDGGSATTLYFDAVAAELGIHVATAAGNTGSAASTIGLPADGYNVISVGAFDDAGSTSRSDDAIAWFSSRGPTTDGRVKPDVTVPGVSITTLSATWEGSAADFYSGTGTSIATPHVSGALALLADGGAISTPEGARALLLTTTHHASPYPSTPGSDWGYGGANLAAAWAARASVAEDSLDQDGPTVALLRTGAIAAGGRVTLCWNRHVTYAGTSAPSAYSAPTDLDLYVYDFASGALLGSSTSAGDTREQVALSSATSAALVRVVRSGEFPSGVTSEPFAVAAESTGATVVLDAEPTYTAAVGLPAFVRADADFDVGATLTNTGARALYGATVELVAPAGFTLVGAAARRDSGLVAGGASATFAWTVRSPAGPEDEHEFRLVVEAPSYVDDGEDLVVTGRTTLDSTPPTCTAQLVGAAATALARVTLQLSASDPGPLASGTAAMRIDPGSETFGAWEEYAPSLELELAGSDGPKWLRVEVRDRAGNVSVAPAAASVVLDTRAPTCAIELNDGATYVLPIHPLVARITATESSLGSGVADFRHVVASGEWSAWSPLEGAAAVELVRPAGHEDTSIGVAGQVRDHAGNSSFAFATIHLIDEAPPSMTLVKSWRGVMSAGGDFDAVTIDYVAGDLLTFVVRPKGPAKKSDFGVDVVVHAPTGEVLVTISASALAKSRPVPFRLDAPESTGRLWLVVIPTGARKIAGGTYRIDLRRKSAPANRGARGTADPDPQTGVVEIPFAAAEGTTLSGSLHGPIGGDVELVAPDGSVHLVPTKGARKTRTLARIVLSGGAGTYRLRVPASGSIAYRLSLSLRSKGVGEEAR